MKKPHIKRYRLPLTNIFLWGAFQTRASRRPFILSSELSHAFSELADWTLRKNRAVPQKAPPPQ